jgi:predicted O-methyltransferase YrrM
MHVDKRNWTYFFNAKSHLLLHSNELYTWYKTVLLASWPRDVKKSLLAYRKQVSSSIGDVQIEQSQNFGAPSKKMKPFKSIDELLADTRISMRYGKILHNILSTFDKEVNVLELGTSTGFSAITMALHPNCKHLDSVDANQKLLEVISPFVPSNIQVHAGLFAAVVPEMCAAKHYDLVFVDGDHTGESTWSTYRFFKHTANRPRYLVFDDINWSTDMLMAWQKIVDDAQEFYTIETFRIGIVWFKPQQRKVHLKAFY